MKLKDRMVTAIRSRKDLPPVHVSLKRLLEKGDMANYLNLCSDRLAGELMVDGEEVSFNFADFPDILFTSKGFFGYGKALCSSEGYEIIISLYMDHIVL